MIVFAFVKLIEVFLLDFVNCFKNLITQFTLKINLANNPMAFFRIKEAFPNILLLPINILPIK